MEWLLFGSAMVALIQFAYRDVWRRYPALCVFVVAYAASRLLPHDVNDPHWWRSTWLWITGVLLPLRFAMAIEASRELLRDIPERLWAVAGAVSIAAAAILILLPFRPMALDYWSFLAARQYAQIAMAVYVGFLMLYAVLRPIRGYAVAHAAILLVLLADYAIAATFDARTGLASGFFIITTAVWATTKIASSLILALCFVAWAAAANGFAGTPAREHQQD